MSCREIAEFLLRYLSDELSPAERSAFEEHIQECPDCHAYLRTYEETICLEKVALAGTAGPIPPDIPEDLVVAILAAVSSAS